MARLWESALHFEPTSICFTPRPRYPTNFAPEGRVVLRFVVVAALSLPLYPTPVGMTAPVPQLALAHAILVL